MRPLTNRQSALLEFVVEYSSRRGFPPTLREIGNGTGLSNISAVRGHVMALEKKGYIGIVESATNEPVPFNTPVC